MFCARCGSFVKNEGAKFCYNCGYELNSYSAPSLRYRGDTEATGAPAVRDPGIGMSKRNKTIAVCLVLALAMGSFIGLIGSGYLDETGNKVEIVTLSDGMSFELSGDFLPERGILSVSLTNEGSIAFTLDDEISSKYGHFSWWFFDRDHVASVDTVRYIEYNGEFLEKNEPVLYYLSQKVGEYYVSVSCDTKVNERYVHSVTYSGTVSYIGTIMKEYTWKYQGKEYTANTEFSYNEYRSYRDAEVLGRAVTDYKKIANFVTYQEPAVVMLAESLREAYDGGDTTGQGFASFVLSFVQLCFKYPPSSSYMGGDKYQYGQEEYFSFPLETIFYGMGDCEDTSILAAALFKALGYSAGVIVAPGHAMAAVGLETYSEGPYSARSYEIISKNIGGMTYYACETTVSNPQGVGIVGLNGYDGHPYSEYINKRPYGFYIV